MNNYNLEDRSLNFSRNIRNFVKILPKKINNIDDCKQLIRSSGSIGANYIEANESLSKKDFIMRIKIAKKEARETIYWLKLIDPEDDNLKLLKNKLIIESQELMNILGSILTKSQK